MIREKTGGNFTLVSSVIILFAGLVGSYFDETIFYSLTGCAVFLLTAKCILKIYYYKKY